MADHDFSFALDLSDERYFEQMLVELARVVLRSVGYEASLVHTMTSDVQAALAAGAVDANGPCDVRFRASGGTLRISVAFAGGRTWETARPLPVRS